MSNNMFETPDVSNYGNQNGLLPFLSQLFGGYTEAHNAKLAQQQTQTENQYKQKYLDYQNQVLQKDAAQQQNVIDQQNRERAKAGYDQINQMFIKNPAYAKDPNIVKQWNEYANTAGIPAARNADGTPNIDSLKPGWNEVSSDEQIKIMQMPQEQRKIILEKFAGVPKNAYTTDEYVTQAIRVKQQQLTVNTKNADTKLMVATEGLAIRKQLADSATSVGDARIVALRAQAARATAEASAIPQRIAISQQNAVTAANRAQTAFETFKASNNRSNLTQVATAIKDFNSALNTAEKDLITATNNYNTQLNMNGADPESPQVALAKDAIDQAQSTLNGLKSHQAEYNAALSSTAGYANNLAKQGGGTNVNVSPSGQGQPAPKLGKSVGKAPPEVPPGFHMLRGRKVYVDAKHGIYPQ